MRLLTNRFFAIGFALIVFIHFMTWKNGDPDDPPTIELNYVYLAYFVWVVLLILKKLPAEKR
ncbi:MAG: hypothetical protein IAE95_07785 [Chitinophagaceae bacterium]|nr:hypothetical protein [Chitinophagaceae bacterium]